MVFSAPTFLFLFLPVVAIAVHLAPRPARNAVLLAASLFFYAWGEREYVVLMLASIGFNYAAGRALGAPWLRDHRARRRAGLALAVGANLALIAWFKYAAFLAGAMLDALGLIGVASADAPPAALEGIHLPIGISFFTFQAISYLVDVARGAVPPQRRFVDLALFIALFPQLIAGPIVRYKDLAAQLADRHLRLPEVAEGVRRFTIGLSKKVLVANPLGVPADAIFALPAVELAPGVAWFGLVCYSLQIYFDFSGYSDMAIGLGRLFGFRLPENFDRPYRARSITDFWRRWHISLSTWFRDYLYVPLGGNRRGPWRTHRNLFVVFLLCGLWHGASWTFVVWGLAHGGLLVFERSRLGRGVADWPEPLARAYCLLGVALAWVFFRCETLADAGRYLASLAGQGGGESAALIVDFASIEALVVAAIALAWATVDLEALSARARAAAARGVAVLRLGDATASARATVLAAAWPTVGLAALWLLCGMKLASRTYDPFLYFRF